MKLSLNWIKQYTTVDVPVDELVRKIGAQLGEVEGVEDLGPKYDKAVIVKVVSCDDHPNADRLHVCSIDDGGITPDVKRQENGLVQVVCGAPNVAAGKHVVWLPPGATVPESYGKEPFVLEARELRGVISNGMLASPKELALGDSHEGLLLLDDDTQPGTPFATAYGLDDTIIDIENKMFTHRPDLFGELGLAREVAGIFGQTFQSPAEYKAPKTTDGPAGPLSPDDKLKMEIRNELPELVPRFIAEVFSGVSVKPSPVWLQTYLSRVGIRPINNVVDITNYFMVLTGQPSHAYDYDKVMAQDPGADHATLVVRNPRDNERLTLLNGKTIDPRQDAIVIATETRPIGLGGVMGGADTEIDEHTTNVILEVATFDMYNTRRSSMEHGIFSDAVTRFTKGQSPLQNDRVEAMLRAQLICDAGAVPGRLVYDLNHLPDAVRQRDSLYPPVPVTAEFINARLGLQLSAVDMQRLLENVEFNVAVDNDTMTIAAPFWRTDIETREDIVEEIGRLYGYDHLPLALPLRSTRPVRKDPLLELKSRIRSQLVRDRANEVLTYSFVHGDLIARAGQNTEEAFRVGNALSPDLQYYRLSLTPSLLDKIHPNSKAGYDAFALFELGKAHERAQADADGLPLEFDNIAFVYTTAGQGGGAAFYQARLYLENLLRELGHELELVPLTEHVSPIDAPFEPGRSAIIKLAGSPDGFGIVGEYRAEVRRALKLPPQTAGFELGIGALLQAGQARRYQPLPRFPKVRQDITLKLASEVRYGDVLHLLQTTLRGQLTTDMTADWSPLGVYQSAEDTAHKNLSFRLTIASNDRTLTDAEVSQLLDQIAIAAADALQAARV